MAYVCVICSIKEPPLMALSVELRRLLEAIVAPVINTAELKAYVLLVCSDCKMLMQSVHNFQQMALNGVRNLKLLLSSLGDPNTDKPSVVIEDVKLMLKQEPEPEILITQREFVPALVNPLSEIVTVKFEPEFKTEADYESASKLLTDCKNTYKGPPEDLIKTLPQPDTSVPDYVQIYEEWLQPKAKHIVKRTKPVYVRQASKMVKVAKPSQLAIMKKATNPAQLENLTPKTVKIVALSHAAKQIMDRLATTVATKSPTVAAKLPTVATKLTTVATDLPTVATKLPTVATKLPTVATKVPTVATKLPTVATKVPTVATKLPTVATKLPTVATKVPTVATTLPTVALPAIEAKGTAAMITSQLGIEGKTKPTLQSILERIKSQRVQNTQGSLKHFKQQTLQLTPAVPSSIRKVVKRDRSNRIRKKPQRTPCPVCDKIMNVSTLRDHVNRMHGPFNPVSCHVCDKQCRNESVLNLHILGHKYSKKKPQSIDDLNPELFCKECCLSFRNRHEHKAHFSTLKHMPRELYKFECDTCKRRFLDKARIKSHIVVVHLRKKEHKCGQCDSAFYRRDKLREHVEITHEKRAKLRKHVCDLCGKTFSIKKTLREHLLFHQGLRPFQCKLCPSTFTYSAALYTHNKLKHLKIKNTGKKKKAPEETQTNVD